MYAYSIVKTKKLSLVMFNKRKRILQLEDEKRKLQETILEMAIKISWFENKLHDLREAKKKEWTVDPKKKRTYN
jgi:hypothetical protein